MSTPVGRTLRSTSSIVSFGLSVILVVFLFGDAAVRGSWGLVARWLPLAVFLLWCLWVLLCRSSVRVERGALVVTNMLRSHTVPWSRVESIDYRPQLRLQLDDGHRLDCWGGPTVGRAGLRGTNRTDPERMMLEGAWDSAPSSSEPIRSQWETPAVGLGGLLLVLSVVAGLFVRQ